MAEDGASEALAVLHKGLGVRCANLYQRLGPELRAAWAISGRDPQRVRAQVEHRLEVSLRDLADERLVLIARVCFNLHPDPALSGLKLGRRQVELAHRLGVGWRTVQRMQTEEVVPQVRTCLGRPWPAGTVTERPAAEPPRPRSGGFDAVRALRDPRSLAQRAVQQFLDHEVHVPCARTGGLVAIRLAGAAAWVCAFTRADRLEDYRRNAGADWAPDGRRMRGADLARAAGSIAEPMGILLDPHAGEGSDLTGTFSIPPDLTARIGDAATRSRTLSNAGDPAR